MTRGEKALPALALLVVMGFSIAVGMFGTLIVLRFLLEAI